MFVEYEFKCWYVEVSVLIVGGDIFGFNVNINEEKSDSVEESE